MLKILEQIKNMNLVLLVHYTCIMGNCIKSKVMKSKCLSRDWAGNAMSLLNSLMAEEDSGNLAVTLYFTSSQVSRSGGEGKNIAVCSMHTKNFKLLNVN